MIKLICDICKKEVDRQDVCDEDGHATKDAMIDIEVLTTYCREYGGHYLICVDCYNNINDFINSRHKQWGWPKNPREGENFNDYLTEQLKDPEFKKEWENALKEEENEQTSI